MLLGIDGADLFNPSAECDWDMVPLAGLEPARPYGQQILNLPRLPIPPQGLRQAETARQAAP